MPPRRVLIPALAALALAACAPSAQATWFPSEAIDGPSADLVKIGGVDMARDGNGALVYIKREAGVPHVYLARFAGGGWQAPERVDAGIAAGASDATVAVGDGFKVMILWTAAGGCSAAPREADRRRRRSPRPRSSSTAEAGPS